MEDVLEVYKLPYDPMRPLLCMDEQPLQFIKETRKPLPMRPGSSQKFDFEYERNGTGSAFMFTEPLNGWRTVSIRERRTIPDWAEEMSQLLEGRYADCEKVILVMDNLNTHKIASFYETFSPERARKLAAKLEIHYTPKHGSWLNVAECELSVFTRQCLSRRIPDIDTMRQEATAWEQQRNATQTGVNWRFETKDARVKLKWLYPQIQI